MARPVARSPTWPEPWCATCWRAGGPGRASSSTRRSAALAPPGDRDRAADLAAPRQPHAARAGNRDLLEQVAAVGARPAGGDAVPALAVRAAELDVDVGRGAVRRGPDEAPDADLRAWLEAPLRQPDRQLVGLVGGLGLAVVEQQAGLEGEVDR